MIAAQVYNYHDRFLSVAVAPHFERVCENCKWADQEFTRYNYCRIEEKNWTLKDTSERDEDESNHDPWASHYYYYPFFCTFSISYPLCLMANIVTNQYHCFIYWLCLYILLVELKAELPCRSIELIELVRRACKDNQPSNSGETMGTDWYSERYCYVELNY